MDTACIINCLKGCLGEGKVRSGEPMSLHTTFRVGGPADIFITPGAAVDVALAIRNCREARVPLVVLGNGSNLLVRDGGIRGVVMHLGDRFSSITVENTLLKAEAGALLSKVSAEAYRLNLTGMEFASGIPGSVGGAAAMNAGAYGREMKDIVHTVLAATPDGDIVKFANSAMDYTYRHSRALDEGLIIVEVEFMLHRGDMAESKALLEGYAVQRREKQPLELPSAGSFFKRPPGHFTGKLIEQAGLMGYIVGGAQVSMKHAGFIVNTGGATASDVLTLASVVRKRVHELYGVELEMEVRIVGEEL